MYYFLTSCLCRAYGNITSGQRKQKKALPSTPALALHLYTFTVQHMKKNQTSPHTILDKFSQFFAANNLS